MIPWLDANNVTLYHGDCRAVLAALPDQSVNCCVTSPPYWGLRDYGTDPLIWTVPGAAPCEHVWGDEQTRALRGEVGDKTTIDGDQEREGNRLQSVRAGAFCDRCGAWRGCLGLEPTPDLYVQHIVEIFRGVRDALADDGTLWLNLGDSYATGAGKVGECPGGGGEQGDRWNGHKGSRGGSAKQPHTGAAVGPLIQPKRMPIPGMKPKDLVGIPWMVAFALRADGWYLRQDIIWHKPNPMPESVTDRCTKAHEYIFLLSKSERYFYDAEAVAEAVAEATIERLSQPNLESQIGSDRVPGKTNGNMKAVPPSWNGSSFDRGKTGEMKETRGGLKRSGNKERKPASARGVPVDTNGKTSGAVAGSILWEGSKRNKRSVWTVTTKPYSGAHFATFPTDLIEPCILAGCPGGGGRARSILRRRNHGPGLPAAGRPLHRHRAERILLPDSAQAAGAGRALHCRSVSGRGCIMKGVIHAGADDLQAYRGIRDGRALQGHPGGHDSSDEDGLPGGARPGGNGAALDEKGIHGEADGRDFNPVHRPRREHGDQQLPPVEHHRAGGGENFTGGITSGVTRNSVRLAAKEGPQKCPSASDGSGAGGLFRRHAPGPRPERDGKYMKIVGAGSMVAGFIFNCMQRGNSWSQAERYCWAGILITAIVLAAALAVRADLRAGRGGR